MASLSLQSAPCDLTVIAGQELQLTIRLWEDEGQTVPVDISDWTFSAVFEPLTYSGTSVVLGLGTGLTIVDGTQLGVETSTAGWTVGRGRWYLQAFDELGGESFPLRGTLTVGAP